LNYIYKRGKKEKIKINNNNIKILTNIYINLYKNNYYNKYLSKTKKLKLDFINKSINDHDCLSSNNRKNVISDFSIIENSTNLLDKKETINKANTNVNTSLLVINEKKIFEQKRKKLQSPNKNMVNFPKIKINNNNFYNNVVFGYKKNSVTLNKNKIQKYNTNYLSLLSKTPLDDSCKSIEQKLLYNKKNYINRYDCLIYDNIKKDESETKNKIIKDKNNISLIKDSYRSHQRTNFSGILKEKTIDKNSLLINLIKSRFKLKKKLYVNIHNINEITKY
jgi:hypothetical protein